MIPWILLDQAKTPDGRSTMTLHQRGKEFSIRVDNHELMNSRMHGSEEALANLTCAAITGPNQLNPAQDQDTKKQSTPHILIGGLGMGFTLAACTKIAPKGAQLTVAELMPTVATWNRGPLAELADNPLADKRVRVAEGDIRLLLHRAEHKYDAIILDVDNGPEGLTQAANGYLYSRDGLKSIARALRPGGALGVWSVHDSSVFTNRLKNNGYKATVHRVSARSDRGPKHTIWVATRKDARA